MNDRLTPDRENEIRGALILSQHHGERARVKWDEPLIEVLAELDACRRDLAEERARTSRLTAFIRRARPLLGMSISNSLGAQADKLLAECGAGTEQPA